MNRILELVRRPLVAAMALFLLALFIATWAAGGSQAGAVLGRAHARHAIVSVDVSFPIVPGIVVLGADVQHGKYVVTKVMNPDGKGWDSTTRFEDGAFCGVGDDGGLDWSIWLWYGAGVLRID